ncbi:hypothetical protein PPL_04882 [Heterostelium album PN500]|uniref:Uncharacterized protein n=1 Tax=Heterostelium pallidum (strain ATCC 26659 / Pp 5 / PN500) TaxID=670386 RepID=D3B8T9_HETP5|nr:hypothetical protein PPL_04882 [Heterostelium album PN500]EFA82457.1 hypothetical protein PPL_04882 [Heterostelium album PN500]|eukprot:XP_020434574.1 hypothetical protein PPL_04882 [Heterostelium album PN500]
MKLFVTILLLLSTFSFFSNSQSLEEGIFLSLNHEFIVDQITTNLIPGIAYVVDNMKIPDQEFSDLGMTYKFYDIKLSLNKDTPFSNPVLQTNSPQFTLGLLNIKIVNSFTGLEVLSQLDTWDKAGTTMTYGFRLYNSYSCVTSNVPIVTIVEGPNFVTNFNMDFSSETPSIEFTSSMCNLTCATIDIIGSGHTCGTCAGVKKVIEIGLHKNLKKINDDINNELNKEIAPNNRGYLFSGLVDNLLYYTIGMNGTFFTKERENIPALYTPQVFSSMSFIPTDGVAIFTQGAVNSFLNAIYFEFLSPEYIIQDHFASINLSTSDPDLQAIIPFFVHIPDHQVDVVITPFSNWDINRVSSSGNEFVMYISNPIILVSFMVYDMPQVYANISLSIDTMAIINIDIEDNKVKVNFDNTNFDTTIIEAPQGFSLENWTDVTNILSFDLPDILKNIMVWYDPSEEIVIANFQLYPDALRIRNQYHEITKNLTIRFFVDSNANNVFDSNEKLYTGHSWVSVQDSYSNNITDFKSYFGSEIVIRNNDDYPWSRKVMISTFDNHYPISPIFTIEPLQTGVIYIPIFDDFDCEDCFCFGQIKSESLVLQFNTGTYNTSHFGYCPTINSHLCIHYSVLDFPPYCDVELNPDGILTVSH